ncbi:nucleoid-associated protein [Plasticicumulans lactativorans]|uniref:Nucleoid-associated protein n=1 Tax=Plasticicumulans lactativorans TaxID=1133106 RepID=A0A4R2L8K0_9GAMM|nr:nucleoid-associated protein [Plasticicumulans lactativorans]TCO80539.1 nucleoid-associated protein [Plasticicumulans lactativorans]
MPIAITEATIHQLIKKEKTQGDESVAVKPRTTVLPNDEVLQQLCTDLINMYGQVANSNGTLGIDPNDHKWPLALSEYVEGNLAFMPFTDASVECIATEMRTAFLSNGGYALFLRYQVDVQDFLLVAMLKLKEGAGVDAETLDLKATLNIDLAHLNEAARVNLTRWRANEQPHLTFIKGRAKSAPVSDYFRDALACTNFTDSKHHTEKVIQAAKDFIEAQEWATSAEKKQAHQDMRARLVACFEQSKIDVPLSTVAAAIHPDAPDDFLTFVREKVGPDSYNLNDRFAPHRKSYIGLKRITGKMGSVSVAFDVADVLAERVKYDPDINALILTSPSDELKSIIEENAPDPDAAA